MPGFESNGFLLGPGRWALTDQAGAQSLHSLVHPFASRGVLCRLSLIDILVLGTRDVHSFGESIVWRPLPNFMMQQACGNTRVICGSKERRLDWYLRWWVLVH